jgi:aspartate kinase
MIVMKFGGTSVADAVAIGTAVSLVARARDVSGRPPVVVVSAMAGVTDALLALADSAERRIDADAAVETLWQRHLEALHALVPAGPAGEVAQALAAHRDELVALLRSAAILRGAAPAARDAIAAMGELMNSRIVAAALESRGVPAAWVDARSVIVTDAAHGGALPLAAETTAAVASAVRPDLEAGRVPVVGGFVGSTVDGVTTTLGRGGSDYSASIVGAALEASEIQIWTDVDGMLTADPRVIPDARVVPLLSFDEASELAYFGAKVLHPSTILPAVPRGIPVRILNTLRTEAPGTIITREGDGEPGPIAAVACKRGITMIEIVSMRMLMTYGFLRRVFEVFERFRTPVDVVTTSEVSVSVTVDDAGRVEEIAAALSEIAGVRVEGGMAIVSAVGEGLRADTRVAARVIGTLCDFHVRMVSQGASRRNVTIVLHDRDAARAMVRLHEEFFGDARIAPGLRPDGAADRVALS